MGAFLSLHRRSLFQLAAAVNLVGIPLVSKGFTNPDLAALDAANFSRGSLFLIMLWGAVYGAVARTEGFPGTTRVFSAIFAAEKMVYVVTWCSFMASRSADVFALRDPVSKLFFATYGLWDCLCALAIFAPAALCDPNEGGAGAGASGEARASGGGVKLA